MCEEETAPITLLTTETVANYVAKSLKPSSLADPPVDPSKTLAAQEISDGNLNFA